MLGLFTHQCSNSFLKQTREQDSRAHNLASLHRRGYKQLGNLKTRAKTTKRENERTQQSFQSQSVSPGAPNESQAYFHCVALDWTRGNVPLLKGFRKQMVHRGDWMPPEPAKGEQRLKKNVPCLFFWGQDMRKTRIQTPDYDTIWC